MDGVNENTGISTDFPFESVSKTQTPLVETETASDYTAESYDNRSDFSDLVASLTSTLDGFADTLSTSYFFSQEFSWITMTAKTSNSDVATAIAYEDAEENVWVLNAEELAQTRSHTTVSLASEDRSGFDSGTYEFDLTVDGTATAIEYTLDNDDTDPLTNHALLQELATVINGSGADVTATVSQVYKAVSAEYYDDESGLETYSSLKVTAADSGSEESFFIEDTSGDLIDILGLGQTLTFGRNSEYTIDGEAFEFYSTTIDIDGDAVKAYLTGESDRADALGDVSASGITQIETEYGFEAASDHVVNVIGQYNDMISWIDENAYFISKSLKTELFSSFNSGVFDNQTVDFDDNGAKTFAVVDGEYKIYDNGGATPRVTDTDEDTLASRMAGIGLTLNNDGTLGIDSDFQTNFKSKFRQIYDTLSGDEGFFTKINAEIESIQASDEDRYVYTANHVLVYTADAATTAKKIYQENVSTLISTLA
ncbi:MAG TPA: hypothetical protein DHV36_21490 [Desulfobacteraceae bacterium]|nr:hypothetical protein [Desulfobacteraceae bacterium]